MKNSRLFSSSMFVLLLLLSFSSTFCKNKTESKKAVSVEIVEKIKFNNSVEYFLVKDPESSFDHLGCGLFATYKGEKYPIINCGGDFIFLALDTILDFNQDGLDDALVWDGENGGNASSGSLFICTPDKNMKFTHTESFMENSGEISFEEWKGKLSILQNTTETIERFVLQNRKVISVEKTTKKALKAIKELTVEQVAENETEPTVLLVNLDGDNLIDTIFGEYFMRWNLINPSIGFGNGRRYDEQEFQSCKRVGVLASKTKGFNDLVFDVNDIMVWDGKKYVVKSKILKK